MEQLHKKVAYLQGLVDGVELEDGKAKKILDEIVDALEDVVDTLQDLQESQEELEEYVFCVDEDLEDLEEEVYGELHEEDYDFDDDVSYVEVECPECHDTVCFDSEILEDEDLIEVACPNCDSVVFINDDGLEPIEAFDEDITPEDDDI